MPAGACRVTITGLGGGQGKKHGRDRQDYGATKPLPANYVCNACNTPGHWKKDCLSHSGGAEQGGWERGDQGVMKPIPANYVCNACNMPGHWKKDCPAFAGIAGGGVEQGWDRGEHGALKPVPVNYVCNICNTPGHWKKDCMMPADYVCDACNTPGHWKKDCPTFAGGSGGRVGPAQARDGGGVRMDVGGRNREQHAMASVRVQVCPCSFSLSLLYVSCILHVQGEISSQQ